MLCDDIADKILAWQEHQLSPNQRRAVEIHLAECAHCRAFADRLRQLDAAFAAQIVTPPLSADFDLRLWARIQAAPAGLSDVQRAERKQQLQAEFEAGIARLRRGAFAMGGLLNYLTWPALAMVAGWLTWVITASLTARLSPQTLGGLDPQVLAWLAASLVCLTVGLAEIFRERLRIFRV